MEINTEVQRMENWIPGIGEPTHIHDLLHRHFKLGFTTGSEAKILGFQLGHSEQGNVLHAVAYSLLSTIMYPEDYRHSLSDIVYFWKSYFIGRTWRKVSYLRCPSGILW